jgi:hypothetical protein
VRRAGTIKSGGRTRRATKTALEVDDPDIEHFIWSTAKQEETALALARGRLRRDLRERRRHLPSATRLGQVRARRARVEQILDGIGVIGEARSLVGLAGFVVTVDETSDATAWLVIEIGVEASLRGRPPSFEALEGFRAPQGATPARSAVRPSWRQRSSPAWVRPGDGDLGQGPAEVPGRCRATRGVRTVTTGARAAHRSRIGPRAILEEGRRHREVAVRITA